jgi:hypothetical protein
MARSESTVTFRPREDVEVGGQLHSSAPEGFAASHVSLDRIEQGDSPLRCLQCPG